MRFEFILGVSIVNFGLKCVHSHQTGDDKAVLDKPFDESRIREKFQNLFDSIAKNDPRKTGALRDTLKKEAAQGQQAYDAVHDEIQYSRKKNSHKEKDPYEMSEHAAYKRNVGRTRSTAKYGCHVGWGAKLPPGKHSLDVDTCIVWYCNHNEEMEDHRCKDIERYERMFPVFWQDCLQNACF